jgi:hypothetical protein
MLTKSLFHVLLRYWLNAKEFLKSAVDSLRARFTEAGILPPNFPSEAVVAGTEYTASDYAWQFDFLELLKNEAAKLPHTALEFGNRGELEGMDQGQVEQ